MPPYPRPTNGGSPLALAPYLAGRIRVKIVHGLPPKAAFAIAGISKFTYNRYLKRANTLNTGDSNALHMNSDQNDIDHYLFGYFVLQSMALEVASIQFVLAQKKILQGTPTKTLSKKTVTRSRQHHYGYEIVTLRDTTVTEFERCMEHRPQVPKQLFFKDDFEPEIDSTT